jgi:excisionase family DNA binding protein
MMNEAKKPKMSDTNETKAIGVGQLSAGITNSDRGSGDLERCTLSVEEAGRLLGISRGAAYSYARDGSIPTIRLGRRLLVPRAALIKMLQID